MKLTKKQLTIIGAALVAVIVAIVAIVAIAGGKDEDKPELKQENQQAKVETIVYELQDPESGNYAVIKQTGDHYGIYASEDGSVLVLAMEFFYSERDGWQQFTILENSGMGSMFAFKDGVAQEWMVGKMLYTKTTENGMTVYDTPQGRIAEVGGKLVNPDDAEMEFNKVSDGYYVYQEGDMVANVEITDEHIVLCQLDSPDNDAELKYEPGKQLEVFYQGETLGVRVEGNELILSVYGDEIRLPRK